MSAVPSPRPGARPAPGDRLQRVLHLLVGSGSGVALGAALDLVLPGSVPVALWVLGGSGLVALLVVARLDDRRLVEDLAAGPGAPPPRPPILRGSSLASTAPAVLVGLFAWHTVRTSPLGALLWVLTAVPFVVGSGLLARVGARRRLDAGRAAHPGAGVVLAGFSEIGGVVWARWARSAGVRVPDRAAFASLLVGDADGLEHRVSHDGPLLHRWSWDEVELSRASDPDGRPRAVRSAATGRSDRAVLVLTVLGPEPAPLARAVPVRRQRSEVTLRVVGGSWTVPTAAVVDAAIATLCAAAEDRGTGGDLR